MNEIESIINENKADILKSMKKSYEDQIEYIGVPDDSNRFSWENNKHLKFYFTSTTYDEDLPGAYKLIIFAIKSEKDDIEYKDIIEETNNFEYSQLQISEKENYILSTFYNNTVGIIKNSLNSSVMTIFFDFNKNQLKEKFISFLNKQMKDFAIREYKSTSERLKEYPDSLISFDQKKYYVDTFEFKKMVDDVDNDQFADELFECLFAYENEKWFLCSSSLGPLIEELMYLTLKNYNNHEQMRKLGRHPTESNYLNAFMLPPISIDHRQSTLIDTWFRARNSTSHFNTGITSKSVCDLMLTGLTSMYNDYFLPSKAYRLENQQH